VQLAVRKAGERASEQAHRQLPTDRHVFSIPAYIGAAAAGSVVMIGLFVVATHPRGDLWAGVAASLFAAIPIALSALLLCLPMTLLSYWLANRFALHSRLAFTLLGTLVAAATTAVVLIPSGVGHPASLRILAFAAIAGAVAGCTYHGLETLARRTGGTR
jgi:hypothetical protein